MFSMQPYTVPAKDECYDYYPCFVGASPVNVGYYNAAFDYANREEVDKSCYKLETYSSRYYDHFFLF